jgi:hypothetical protein
MRKPPATTAILYCVFATYAKPAVAAVREVSRRLARLAEYCASVLIEIPENRLRLGLEFMVESRADDLATLDGAEGRLRHNDHVGSMGCLLLRKTRGERRTHSQSKRPRQALESCHQLPMCYLERFECSL